MKIVNKYLYSIVAFSIIFSSVVALITPARTTRAISPRGQCRVVLAVDTSGSIADTTLNAFANQIELLFSPTASSLSSRNDVQVAFWTFSDGSTQSDTDINKFSRNYTSTNVYTNNYSAYTGFSTALRGVQSDAGLTNYANGFGYSSEGPQDGEGNSVFTLKPSTSNHGQDAVPISSISHPNDGDPDLIVLLTDGFQNSPGLYTGDPNNPLQRDGNDAASNAARQAMQKYNSSVTKFAAGYLSSATETSLDYITSVIPRSAAFSVPNYPTPFTNVELLAPGGLALSTFLEGNILRACGNSAPAPPYSLFPTVNTTSTVEQVDGTVDYTYSVMNTGSSNGSSPWQQYDVTIDPSVTGDPLSYSGSPANCTVIRNGPSKSCDTNLSVCGAIMALLGPASNNSCDTSGPTGNTGPVLANGIMNPPSRSVIVKNLPPGSKVCSVLALSTPATAVSATRISSAGCVVVGKTPLLQIHGGDVRVGRQLGKDTVSPSSPSLPVGIYMSSFKITGSGASAGRTANGVVFGSWVEYGALAPGPIIGMASLAGAEGGYLKNSAGSIQGCASGNDLSTNRLTFANKNSATNRNCGYYPDVGRAPDIITAVKSLTQTTNIPPSITDISFSPSSIAGRFGKASTNNNTAFTIGAGGPAVVDKTYHIYLPDSTVTIKNDIQISGYDTTDIMDPGAIPQLIIIAKNIKIQKNVKRIDAWLIAWDKDYTSNSDLSSTDGVVNTCSDLLGGAVNPSNTCNEPLTINGPIIARQLQPWRTTVYNSVCTITSEVDLTKPNGCVRNVANPINVIDYPGEIVNLPGSTFLWAISQHSGNGSINIRTTLTKELPPFY